MIGANAPRALRTAHATAIFGAPRDSPITNPSELKYAKSVLKRLQVLKQFLFVLVGQLRSVRMALVAVPFFSRIEKKIRVC